MDLSRLKQLIGGGMSYEEAYGSCIQQLAKSENQMPNHKVQEARRKSSVSGAMRSSNGTSNDPRMVQQIDRLLQSGISQKDIARVLEVSQYTISRAKKRHNLPTKRPIDG